MAQARRVLTAAVVSSMLASAMAAASRPSFSFINSPLVHRDALQHLLPTNRAPVAMSTAPSVDAADLFGQIISLPLRVLAKLCRAIGALVPDRLPSWWTVRTLHALPAGPVLLETRLHSFATNRFQYRLITLHAFHPSPFTTQLVSLHVGA